MRKGFVEVRLDGVDCLHHVLGGRSVDCDGDEKNENVENNVEVGVGQPLEVVRVIQAECKPPLAVSNLLELGVCNRDDNILGIEEGW